MDEEASHFSYFGQSDLNGEPLRQDTLEYFHDPRVGEGEILNFPSQPTLIPGIGEMDVMMFPDNPFPDIRDYNDFPVSTAQEFGDFLPASCTGNEDFSNDTHSSTPVDTIFNSSMMPTPFNISGVPPPMQLRDESEPRDKLHQSPKASMKSMVAPSRSPKRPPHAYKTLIRSFSCSDCNKRYVQRQALNRHYQEKHHPKSCISTSCDFKWGRRYEYKRHLREEHPDVDPDTVLD